MIQFGSFSQDLRVNKSGNRKIVCNVAKGASKRVQLGTSDLNVSECCLGTMTWGQQNTEQEAHEQLNWAFEQGINFLDTAEIYPVPPNGETQGLTEKYIGSWLKNRKRDDVVVATKVAGASAMFKHLRGGTRVQKAQIKEALENSLQRLQTDYVDLYQIHWPDRYIPIFGSSLYKIDQIREAESFESQLEALKELVEEGKIRHIGVSNESSYGVCSFIHAAQTHSLPKIQTIQNVYNLNARNKFDMNLVETCHAHKVSLLAYSPLAGGSLTGKYRNGVTPEGSRLTIFPGYMGRYRGGRAERACEQYYEVAVKHGLTMTELALAWCQSRAHVASSIIGATSMEQLKENVRAFDVELSEECVKDVEELALQYRDPEESSV